MRLSGEKRLATTLGPIDTVIAHKFIKTLSVNEGLLIRGVQAQQHKHKCSSPPDRTFKTGTELLYGGQGKTNSIIKLMPDCDTQEKEGTMMSASNIRTRNGGLNQPMLDDTNEEVIGDGKRRLRIQNKQRKRRLKATQQQESQWTEHTGQMAYESTPLPRTRGVYHNFMSPTGRALNHPAADILCDWATFGCPTRTGKNWTKEEMWEAVEWGPHRSATSPEALQHFAEEIKKKIQATQACLVPWEDIKHNPPPQLKISPIAAIPHKSKAFR